MATAMARRLFHAYERALYERPLMTKASGAPPPLVRIHLVRLLHGRRVCRLGSQAMTSALVGGAGDLTCQCAFEKRELNAIDWRRCTTFTALGGLMVAPARVLHATPERNASLSPVRSKPM